MSGVVLVTGAAMASAAKVARTLADLGSLIGITKVVAVDSTFPAHDLGSAKFVRADIRTSVIGKIIAVEDVETVIHMDLSATRGRAGSAKEFNVIGSMQVMAACQRSESVRRFVLISNACVYGTSPKDPAVFKEANTARAGVNAGFPKDVVEVEGYMRGLARRRPDMVATTLRIAQVVTPQFSTPLGRYFANPVLPIPIGFDARLQFLHPDDGMEAIVKAATEDHPGTFNVAGEGVLMLSQAARILGKPVLPLLPIGFGSSLRSTSKFMGTTLPTDLSRLLTYGRVIDTKALREEFGFTPKYSSMDAFNEFAASLRPGVLQWGGSRW
jgi:UDP-glucose 4-epimerase